jgi:AbrB family looped-hinge helix DNA binding protein
MNTCTSTVSPKYQVVIPKELRKKLQIQPGQKVSFSLSRRGQIVMESPRDALADIQKAFAGKHVWGHDPVATIRKQRDEWDG